MSKNSSEYDMVVRANRGKSAQELAEIWNHFAQRTFLCHDYKFISLL